MANDFEIKGLSRETGASSQHHHGADEGHHRRGVVEDRFVRYGVEGGVGTLWAGSA